MWPHSGLLASHRMDYSSADDPTIGQVSMADRTRSRSINKAVPSAGPVQLIKGLAGILKVDLPAPWDNWERFCGGYIWDDHKRIL